MDQLLEQARSIYEGEIVRFSLHSASYCSHPLTVRVQDFKGQLFAERLSTALLSISGLLAFLIGYATQDIYQTLYVGLGGTALTFLVVVPPWPFFNQNPQPWLPAKTARASLVPQGITVEVDGKRVQ
jgi:signal peptidase complex subunit 1